MKTKELKYIITENWEEEVLRSLVGDEEIANLKYPTNEYNDLLSQFDSEREYLEITVKRIAK